MPSLLNDALAVVREMKRINFDLLVAEGFRVQGFSVIEFGDGDSPQRPDFSLVKAGKKFSVQCRHWRDTALSVEAVEELARIVADRETDGGFLVTAGGVTADAAVFASSRKIQLVHGPKLLAMMEKAKETITTGVPSNFRWGERQSSSADGR